MTDWVLVPAELTMDMGFAGAIHVKRQMSATPPSTTGAASDAYAAMIAASPDPAEDEGLVERLAKILADNINVTTENGERIMEFYRSDVRAILTELRGKS